jgi:MFS family permease
MGQVVSLAGTWMQQVAQAWLVLELTGDPFMLGLVAAAQYLPVTLLGLFGGLIADQLPKRRTLIVTQVVPMTLALTLFALTATGLVEVWHILVLALLLGTSTAVEMPTRQSFVVELVGRENILNAVGLNAALFNSARVVGPAVAGLTIGAFDVSVAFLVNGLSFLAMIAALVLMREDELRSAPRSPRPHGAREVAETLSEGLRFVRRTPLVLLAVVVVGLVATFGMNLTVLVPALAREVLRTDAAGFGFLMSASGIGSIIAALTVAFARRSRPSLITWGAALLGLSSLVLAFSGVFALSLVALFAIGAGGIGMTATANTVIQMSVPDELRGRVMSVYTTIFAGSVPVGGLLAGFIASSLGVPVALGFGGAVSLVVALAAMAWWSRATGRRGLAPA